MLSNRFLKKLEQVFWQNLFVRAIIFSLLLHGFFVLVYIVLNWKSQTSIYDFGFDSTTSGSSQPLKTKGKKSKKVKLMERSKEEIKPKEKSAFGELPPEEEEVNDASGDEGEIADAVDMAFMPGAPTPSMMGGLKQYYPALARELNVEASVYVSVIISRKGKVLKVKVSRVVLSKRLPVDQERLLKEKFGESITKSFNEVIFTRPVVDGKNVPIEMEQMVSYKLTE